MSTRALSTRNATAANLTPKNFVTFESQSALQKNGTGSATSNLSLSWTHTIAGNCLVIPYISETIGTATTATGTVGGTSMTNLSYFQYYSINFSGNLYYIYAGMLGLLSPPTGSQTVTLNLPSGSSGWLVGGSLSYRNVKSFGTVVSNTSPNGVGVSAVPANQMVVNLLAMWASTPTGYTQTSRLGGAFGTSTAIRSGIIGDSIGGNGVIFRQDLSDTAFGCIALPLKP